MSLDTFGWGGIIEVSNASEKLGKIPSKINSLDGVAIDSELGEDVVKDTKNDIASSLEGDDGVIKDSTS